jgi:hypothetical protein
MLVSLSEVGCMPFFDWLDGRGQGTGAFIGASVGLLAILVGALFNSYLQRRRDKNLRKLETKALASAFLGEVLALYRIGEII